MLAGRRRGLEGDEAVERHIRIERSLYTGTMAEAAGTRVGPTIEIDHADVPVELDGGAVPVGGEPPIEGGRS